MHKSLRIALVVLGLVAVIGAIAFLRPEKPNDTKVVRIGAVLPLTGPVAVFGTWIRNGLELAVADINASQSPGGVRIELIVEDSENQAARGLNAASKLVEVDKVDVLVSAMSTVSIPLISFAEEKRIPLLMQDVTYPRVTSQSAWVLRHFIQSDREAGIMMGFIGRQLQLKRLAILHVNDEAGVGARDALVSLAAAHGSSVIGIQGFSSTARDLRSQIIALLRSNPDGVYVFGNGPSWAAAIRQLREQGYQGTIMTNTAMAIDPFRDLAGQEAVTNIYFTMPYARSQSAGSAKFEQAYQTRFGEPAPLEARYAWDLAHLVHLAANRLPSGTGSLIEGLSGLEFDGAFGPVNVPADRDIRTSVGVAVYRDGKREILHVE